MVFSTTITQKPAGFNLVPELPEDRGKKSAETQHLKDTANKYT